MSVTKIASFLERAIGVDFDNLGVTSLSYAIQRRMKQANLTDDKAYASLFLQSSNEQQALIEEVVVPETWFFREPNAFSVLAKEMKPRLRKPETHPLRIHSLGCCTGEEPYSIAMALMHAGWRSSMLSIEAFDISHRALATAETAEYTQRSFRHSSSEQYSDFFVTLPASRVVRNDVRRAVSFTRQNVIDYAEAQSSEKVDIIFCRNLLIYMTETVRRSLIRSMIDRIAEGGFIFLGASESLQMNHPAMHRVQHAGAFAFQKRAIAEAAPQKVAPVAQPTAPLAQPKVTELHSPEVQRFRELPDFDGAYKAALASANSGDYEIALAQSRQLIRDFGAHVKIFSLMGLIYKSLNQVEVAHEWFRKALYLDPNHYETLVHLSYLMQQMGMSQQARQYSERASRLEQDAQSMEAST